MLTWLAAQLGPWTWWLLGLLLLAAELLVPGVFLVWIGIGAIGTGMLSLLFWGAPFWGWQVQILVFAALAVVAILLGRRLVSRSEGQSDEPLLNKRGESLVGRTATLQEPMHDGRGRIRLDDTFWSVMGPDLPAGTKVRIVSSAGRDLTVEAA